MILTRIAIITAILLIISICASISTEADIGARFTGNFRHYPVDNNGDGYYEQLYMEAEMEVEKPGWYQLAAILYDDNGKYICSARHYQDTHPRSLLTYVTLDSGIATMKYGFSGEYIMESKADGFYTAKLSLRSVSGDRGWISAKTSCSSYVHSDFRELQGKILGLISHRPFHALESGRFDSLEAMFEVEVLYPGVFELYAILYGSEPFPFRHYDTLEVGLDTVRVAVQYRPGRQVPRPEKVSVGVGFRNCDGGLDRKSFELPNCGVDDFPD